jgi:predicted lipoprotein with Yx(FWY)xxD motif
MRLSSRLLPLASLAVGAALVAAACSSAASTPASADMASSAPASAGAATSITLGTTNDPTLGAYLTGSGGMTLYVLTLDTPDTSTCTGTCATNWPPLTVASGAQITGPAGATGSFATIDRSDGTVQVTYNHMPLYYYAGDSAAGDTNGQGKNGTWFVAPLSGSVPSGAAPSAASSDTAPADTAPAASATPAASTAAVSGY